MGKKKKGGKKKAEGRQARKESIRIRRKERGDSRGGIVYLPEVIETRETSEFSVGVFQVIFIGKGNNAFCCQIL